MRYDLFAIGHAIWRKRESWIAIAGYVLLALLWWMLLAYWSCCT